MDEDAFYLRGIDQLHSPWQSSILPLFQQSPSLTPKHREFAVLEQPLATPRFTSLPSCVLELHQLCLPFSSLSVKSLGGITSPAPVTLGGKSFPLTSVETSARGELPRATRAAVNQGLFSRSPRCAGNIIPG